MTTELAPPPVRRPGRWGVVAGQELRDLWIAGSGPLLTVAFGALLGVVSYLVATNQALNFLEQRESVDLVLQVAMAVGALLALIGGASAISGERERGTLESLLLTPASRAHIAAGKLAGALSLWAAALLVTIPFVWFLGRGVGIVGRALVAGAVVGTLVAVALASLGFLVSVVAATSRAALAASLFLLLALYAPTQLPTGARKGTVGDVLLRADPLTAGEHYVHGIVVQDRGWGDELDWLASPAILSVGLAVAAVAAGRAVRLGGWRSR